MLVVVYCMLNLYYVCVVYFIFFAFIVLLFCNIQDTILALEALTEFSYRQTNRAFYNLQLVFECTSNSSWTETVRLNKNNFANLYTYDVCDCGSVKVSS